MIGKYADLERMTFLELLEEKTRVKAVIADLIAQKRVSGRPADQLYREWLRKTNLQLSTHVARHDQIKLLLAKRQADAATVKRQATASTRMTPEQLEEARLHTTESRVQLFADLSEGGPDAILVRVRRVLDHLCGSIPMEQLPLDEADRQTLRDLSVYLRGRYGAKNLKAVLQGEVAS